MWIGFKGIDRPSKDAQKYKMKSGKFICDKHDYDILINVVYSSIPLGKLISCDLILYFFPE